MPWSQTTPMDQKTQFVADYLRKRLSITELCELYGISRKTGYKFIDRYLRFGPQGLEELSPRPATCPNRTPEYIEQAIVAARQRHPSWGAKKLLSILHKSHRRWSFPTRSTVCDILSRNGLIPKQRRRRHIGHAGKPISQILAPNDVWSADFKGQFKNRRWTVLLSTYRGRWLQSFLARLPSAQLHQRGRSQTGVHSPIQGIRIAPAHPHRQRGAVCHQHLSAALSAFGVVGTPRDLTRLHRTR
jgi:transposase